MSKSVEFFFDFGSPSTYLAWTQLPQIAAAAGANIIWQPMLLGGVLRPPAISHQLASRLRAATPCRILPASPAAMAYR